MKAQNQFVKVNASFYKKMEYLEDIVEDAVKEELISIAQSAVSFSPVDTGAYVTSFSFTTGAGFGGDFDLIGCSPLNVYS